MKLGEVLNLLNSFVAQFSWKWLFHEKERNSLIFVNIRVELFNFCFFDILPIWARMVRNKLRNSRVVLNPDFSTFSNNVSRLVINEQWQQINCHALKKRSDIGQCPTKFENCATKRKAHRTFCPTGKNGSKI